MTTRRQFARLGLLGGGALSVSPGLAQFTTPAVAEPAFDYVLLDTGLKVNPAITRALSAQALRTVESGEDVGNFWRQSLLPAVSTKATLVAGITKGYSAFVVEELARDYGHGLVHSSHDLDLRAPEELRQELLRPTELNTARPVYWLLAPFGINFHA